MSLMNKFKHSMGMLSTQQYTAITAVEHINSLIVKYNSVMEKFLEAKSDFAKETTDKVLLELLNAISEQATFMVILVDGTESEKHIHRETFKECVGNHLEKHYIEPGKPASVNFEFISHALIGHQDDNWRFREMTTIIRSYKWLHESFKPEIAQRMFAKKLYDSLRETKNLATRIGPPATISQLEIGLMRNLTAETAKLAESNSLNMNDIKAAVSTLILFFAVYCQGKGTDCSGYELPLLSKYSFSLDILNVYSKIFKIIPEESV